MKRRFLFRHRRYYSKKILRLIVSPFSAPLQFIVSTNFIAWRNSARSKRVLIILIFVLYLRDKNTLVIRSLLSSLIAQRTPDLNAIESRQIFRALRRYFRLHRSLTYAKFTCAWSKKYPQVGKNQIRPAFSFLAFFFFQLLRPQPYVICQSPHFILIRSVYVLHFQLPKALASFTLYAHVIFFDRILQKPWRLINNKRKKKKKTQTNNLCVHSSPSLDFVQFIVCSFLRIR